MSCTIPATFSGQLLAVVDVEGNGGQPPEIIEIAILPIDDRPVSGTDTRSWLVHPSSPITSFVTRKVHGITNEDVAHAPDWNAVSGTIATQLNGRVLIAHNASVEHRVLAAHLPGWRPPLVLDTLRLAKKVWPDLNGYGLDALVRHAALDTTEINDQRPHRARYDTWCAWLLLRALAVDSCLTWPELVRVAALPGTGFGSFSPPEGGLW